ncbi:MAG: hypothetical protein AABZ47_10150 [Planctomycetota bacterium]
MSKISKIRKLVATCGCAILLASGSCLPNNFWVDLFGSIVAGAATTAAMSSLDPIINAGAE